MKHKFLNVKIDILNKVEAIKLCKKYFEGEVFNSICFLNAHCCNIAKHNKDYQESIKNSTLLLNDGIGVKIALNLFGIKEKENMNGTDLIPKIIDLAIKLEKNIYLLGGKDGTVDKVEEKLIDYNKNVKIVGKHSGYFNDEESELIIKEINDKKVDLLIVGMGVPLQEIWINENKSKFESVRIAVAGGAILDFIAGNFSRAPIIIRKFNLEWAYRLYLEPKRLWKRYLLGNFKFIYYIFSQKLKIN